MKRYTVKEVARLAGVSVRALHHYDEIGLLKPASTGENRYRYYGREELLRLQQILFHRELGLGLDEIIRMLDWPGFDRLAALRAHRGRLEQEAKRYRRLIRTIDRTIAEATGGVTMTDDELYKGFTPEKQGEYEAWLIERYGDGMRGEIAAGKAAMAARSEAEIAAHMAELKEIETALAAAMAEGVAADSPALVPVLRRHHAWVGRGWGKAPTAEAYRGLADAYGHNDFRARYESIREGLADYIVAAMTAFAGKEL